MNDTKALKIKILLISILFAAFMICNLHSSVVYAENSVDWRSIYLELLNIPNYQKTGDVQPLCGLYYIDDDTIPELAINKNDRYFIYTIDKNKPVLFLTMNDSGPSYGSNTGALVLDNRIIAYENGKTRTIAFKKTLNDKNKETAYYIEGRRVSESAYSDLTFRSSSNYIGSDSMLDSDKMISFLKRPEAPVPSQSLNKHKYAGVLSVGVDHYPLSNPDNKKTYTNLKSLCSDLKIDYENPTAVYEISDDSSGKNRIDLIYITSANSDGMLISYEWDPSAGRYKGSAWPVHSATVRPLPPKEDINNIFTYWGEGIYTQEDIEDTKGMWNFRLENGRLSKISYICRENFTKEDIETGITPIRTDGEIFSIEYTFDNNNKLKHRYIRHDSGYFGTYATTESQDFDEDERLIHYRGYQTHGGYERYFIYPENTDTPAYSVFVDDHSGVKYCYLEILI
ncbi:MAG: hypothetical protein K6F99_08545 [Lachnospiraceae bacterium]|nr:hypothetical protein [Lachnospiraceae bacterium]